MPATYSHGFPTSHRHDNDWSPTINSACRPFFFTYPEYQTQIRRIASEASQKRNATSSNRPKIQRTRIPCSSLHSSHKISTLVTSQQTAPCLGRTLVDTRAGRLRGPGQTIQSQTQGRHILGRRMSETYPMCPARAIASSPSSQFISGIAPDTTRHQLTHFAVRASHRTEMVEKDKWWETKADVSVRRGRKW